ncbi:MAG: NAD(P)H-hydrate dehydratase [Actinobacteria bacterium]|nr:NAD(P)H-hydrate dehydratase [Actinomycetota bacterium]MBW3649933.1 NAD(P)H-hydrate dehydratase [Actinomycetota bacterium]
MIPVVTPDEMRAIDAAAPEPTELLIQRAGAAVARCALARMGGSYGRRVVVVSGKGNNGADGRAAAARLRRRGVRVQVVGAADAPRRLPDCDLVIDAAYGTGFRGSYMAPDPGTAGVLAVDIPSGVDGCTGQADAGAVAADVTVTFAALKPGLLFSERVGEVVVSDIGLDTSGARIYSVEPADVLARLPRRPQNAHKYHSAVAVVAGSPGMSGAAALASAAAMRAGAGYCRLVAPAGVQVDRAGHEVVAVELPAREWTPAALAACDRMAAVAVGPGLGRSESTRACVRRFVAAAPVPLVVDADGLFALGTGAAAAGVLAGRRHPTLLTPHDGEFTRLAGHPPGADRIGAVRELAAELRATVLLKGPVTVVADPDGQVLVSPAGTPALATAGTGDVLTGVVTAFLAAGLSPLEAGGLGAAAHGAAALAGPPVGLLAGDLLALLPRFLSGPAPAPVILGISSHRRGARTSPE